MFLTCVLLKGTAVYTSNFTVPTSPLTNITNTALLTLQSSTIVDNSSNALTITNVGSVTSPLAYPFNTKVFADQSPQGNNWTPSAVSGVAGSTYDYMTDVPTLTSATAANYAVLNPLMNTGTYPQVLTNGNLTTTANANGNGGSTLSTIAMSSGKWYFEVTAGSTVVNGLGVGIAPTTFNPSFQADSYFGYYSNGYEYQANGQKVNNNSFTSYGATWTTGDVIGVAFDADSGILTYYKNNASQGTAFSSIPSGSYFFGVYGYSSATASVNFGQQPFVYTPPSGFVALNTYNL